MVDVREQATLRGFHVSIADINDQMHLCHPGSWQVRGQSAAKEVRFARHLKSVLIRPPQAAVEAMRWSPSRP